MADAYERLRKEPRDISERAGWGADSFDNELPSLGGPEDGPSSSVHFDDHDESWDAVERGTKARFRLRQLSAWAAGHQETFELEEQMKANAAAKLAAAAEAAKQPPASDSVDVTAAIFGLVGVVVGGLFSGVVEWFKIAQDRKRRGRVGARLVTEELLNASMSLRMATEGPDDATVAELARGAVALGLLANGAWHQYGADLADALRDDAWSDVGGAYFALMAVGMYAEMDDDAAFAAVVREAVRTDDLVKAGRRCRSSPRRRTSDGATPRTPFRNASDPAVRVVSTRASERAGRVLLCATGSSRAAGRGPFEQSRWLNGRHAGAREPGARSPHAAAAMASKPLAGRLYASRGRAFSTTVFEPSR